jgi:hypothetical protein
MKTGAGGGLKSLVVAGCFLLMGMNHALLAQGTGQGNSNAGGNSAGKKPAIDVRPMEIPPASSITTAPKHPERPDKAATSPAVTEAIQKAQAERTKFLQDSQAAARINRSSLTEDRQVIRDQMKESLQRLRETQTALRKEIRERVEELKNELSPDFGRVLADVRSEGRGR